MVLLVPTEGETCIPVSSLSFYDSQSIASLPTYVPSQCLQQLNTLSHPNSVKSSEQQTFIIPQSCSEELWILHKDRSLNRDKTKASNTEGYSVRNWCNEINTKCFQTACCSYTRNNKSRAFPQFLCTAVSYTLQAVSYYSCQFQVAIRCVFPVGSAQQSRCAFLLHLGLHAATLPQEPQARPILQSR